MGKVVPIRLHHPDSDKLFGPDVRQLAGILSASGVTIRLVGGAVRDCLMNSPSKDLDFAVDAPPEVVSKIILNAGHTVIPTGIKHGTITVVINKNSYELTTLRRDVETDGRHAKVEWTDDWKEDARRRDFTFNALSVDMRGNVHDYFGGRRDLIQRRVRFVGDAEERINEDYLRILRYFRFRQKVNNNTPVFDDIQIIKKLSNRLDQISGERIWMEMRQILVGPHLNHTLTMMRMTGVLDAIGLRQIQTVACEKMRRWTDNPIAVLARGSLLGGLQTEHRDTLVNRYKISNDEKKLFDFLLEHYDKPKGTLYDADFGVDEVWRYFQDITIMNGAPREWVQELAHLRNIEYLINKYRRWDMPDFPITGQMLLDNNIMEPGPEMGRVLEDLKKEWKKTRYRATREKLFAKVCPDINW